MNEDISRIPESVLSIIGGVSGIIVGLFLISVAFATMGPIYYSQDYCPPDVYSSYGPDLISLLFGLISLSGGVIGIVSGVIFKYYTKIASILAIIAGVLCLVGGIVIFGTIGFVLLLVAGILGFIKK